MREVERIIEKGVLPKEFFEEEVICDYKVSQKMKAIWGVEFDLLVEFDRICRKYDLKYFLAFGALLGAIRHNGFIPWDDDLDVCMPRKDYELFIKVAQDELESPYLMQIPGKDHDYYYSFAKLRNSNTSAISHTFLYDDYNMGLFLDVFALDNCSVDEAEKDSEKINLLILENSTNMRRSLRFPAKDQIERINSTPYRDPDIVLNEMNAIMQSHNDETTEYCSALSITVYPVKKRIYKWEDVLDLVDYEMYGHSFKIPRNYEEILRITYGDYMKFPPVEKRGCWHTNVIFDAERPYTELLQELRNKDYLEHSGVIVKD